MTAKRTIKPPTRGELLRALREASETRMENAALALKLERAEGLLVESAVDRVHAERDLYLNFLGRLRSEFLTSPCDQLCRGPDGLRRWLQTFAQEITDTVTKGRTGK